MNFNRIERFFQSMNSVLEKRSENAMARKLIFSIFVLLVFIWCSALSKRPIYNWDMVGYMGVVLEYSGKSKMEVHNTVYEELKNKLSHEQYNILTNKNEYRKNCYENYQIFNKELNYYRVKPLYTLSVYGLNKLGVGLIESTYLISIISYGLLCLILFVWYNRIRTSIASVILPILLLIFFPFIELATLSTPDALSTLFLVLGYLCFVSNRNRLLIFLLLLATLTRIDNAIILVSFIAYQLGRGLITESKSVLQSSRFLVISISLLVLFFISITLIVGNSLDWVLAFGHLDSVRSYFGLIKSSFAIFCFESTSPIFLVFLILFYRKFGKAYKILIGILIISTLIRFILFPAFNERFFIHFEMVVILAIFNYLQSESMQKNLPN